MADGVLEEAQPVGVEVEEVGGDGAEHVRGPWTVEGLQTKIDRSLDIRTKMTEIDFVTGAEFIRRVKKVGRRKGVSVEFIAERGKGSHGTLYYGTRRITVKHRQKELSPGLFHAMLDQIGLTREDLQQS